MLFYSLLLSLALANTPNRISSGHLDLSKAERIFISPGLVSLIEFPLNIIEVRVGDPKSIKVQISQVSPRELTVYLSSTASTASNLIVRAEKRVFVFDIVPSRSNHQDYVKISRAFGSLNTATPQRILLSKTLEPSVSSSPSSLSKSVKFQTVEVGP